MARENYSFKKYQKELARKKKNEEKKQRKLDKKNMQAPRVNGMPSAPLSAADSEQASNEDTAVT